MNVLPLMGVEWVLELPGYKGPVAVDYNRRSLFMSFQERCVFLGLKSDLLLIESLLLASESYSLTTRIT